MNRRHAHPGPYLPSAKPESLARLLIGAAFLVIFCVAFYVLVVGS